MIVRKDDIAEVIECLRKRKYPAGTPGFGDLPLQISKFRLNLTDLGCYISEISDISEIFPFARYFRLRKHSNTRIKVEFLRFSRSICYEYRVM